MYRSCLLIDVGNNPDRPRPGRLWLRNRYHVHQRLCMAFPSASRIADDEHFLKPFKPDDFGDGQVHVERAEGSGFLFRIDPLANGRAMIIVQSATEPDWGYAFHNADYLLAAPPEVTLFEPHFSKGQRLRFRLAANPTRRMSKHSPDAKEKFIGKRVPVPNEDLKKWLFARAEKAGFRVLDKDPLNPNKDWLVLVPGYVLAHKGKDNPKGTGARLRSVLYDGVLTVEDPKVFSDTIVQGIGSAKAFGFGLLSVAPLPTADQP